MKVHVKNIKYIREGKSFDVAYTFKEKKQMNKYDQGIVNGFNKQLKT